MSRTTKSVIWVLPVSNGDGSASVHYFSTKKKALHYASFESEPFGDGPCPRTFEIRDGQIVGPLDEPHYMETES